MTETFATAVDRLRDIVEEQVDGWRRLLEGTRAGNEALRGQDPARFEEVLAEQVETLRDLKEIEGRRQAMIREVGPVTREDLEGLEAELRRLAGEVSRANRVGRVAVERNGSMVEARLALHRRAGRTLDSAPGGVDRIA